MSWVIGILPVIQFLVVDFPMKKLTKTHPASVFSGYPPFSELETPTWTRAQGQHLWHPTPAVLGFPGHRSGHGRSPSPATTERSRKCRESQCLKSKRSSSHRNLVGGWATPLKNISQLGWLFPIYGKIKNGNQTTNQKWIRRRETSKHSHLCQKMRKVWPKEKCPIFLMF